MAFRVQRVEYFYAMVRDEPGAAYRTLSLLAELGVNLLAFTAVPIGPARAQLGIFPEDGQQLIATAKRAGLALDGPHHVLLVQGDDELGALADVHKQLFDAGVDVYAAMGVTDGRGAFGYLIYVREEQFQRAAAALGI
jgi:hypothetical protein